MKNKQILIFGILFVLLGIIFGAFGAHGLKKFVSEAKLVTFETGVRYQIYHGLALILLALIQKIYSLRVQITLFSFIVGIILFSFNCYFYTLSGEKVFAMIVPLGGVLFIVGWFNLLIQVGRKLE
jgi:uncharacterized membrane protein YgdD (TMEM256/DUF423 family)